MTDRGAQYLKRQSSLWWIIGFDCLWAVFFGLFVGNGFSWFSFLMIQFVNTLILSAEVLGQRITGALKVLQHWCIHLLIPALCAIGVFLSLRTGMSPSDFVASMLLGASLCLMGSVAGAIGWKLC